MPGSSKNDIQKAKEISVGSERKEQMTEQDVNRKRETRGFSLPNLFPFIVSVLHKYSYSYNGLCFFKCPM